MEDWYQKQVKSSYLYGVVNMVVEVWENNFNFNKWINLFEISFFNVLSFKIYCFYGVGKLMERGYWYCVLDQFFFMNFNIIIDIVMIEGIIDYGVIMGEGDGIVNLMSMGYMCNRGWNMK